MLGLRLLSVSFAFRNILKDIPKILKPTTSLASPQPETVLQVPKDKYADLHKSGPQLQVSKILYKHGNLTSREIWKMYQIEREEKRNNNQPYTDYFNSLSHLKKTLSFMRANKKLKNSGYVKAKKTFLGWKIDEKVAFRYVHPEVIAELEQFRRKKNEL